MNNIALLTFYTPDYQDLADITTPHRESYCKRHGYLHFVRTFPYKNKEHYYAFDRLTYIRDLLVERRDIDIIFCINVQSSIMNHSKKIEEFIDNEHDFFITKDNGERLINAGSFIVKNTNNAILWLNHLLSFEDIHNKLDQKEQEIIEREHNNPKFSSFIKILPQNTINSYNYIYYNIPDTISGHFKRGDFILSLPGRPVNSNGNLINVRMDILNSEYVKNNMILE